MVTSGFASMWLLYYPDNQPESRFRHLGQQKVNGREMQVVCFAETPGNAAVAGRFDWNGRTTNLFYQGLAWIDSDGQITRMRLDLLRPHLEVGLERQTTEIQFGQVHFPGTDASRWLPLKVTVTTVEYGRKFRNRHKYSDYCAFTVKSIIEPLTKR